LAIKQQSASAATATPQFSAWNGRLGEDSGGLGGRFGLVSYLASAQVGLHLGQLWAAGDRRFALDLARIWHAPPQQAGPFLS
jgi:hypothetical protein